MPVTVLPFGWNLFAVRECNSPLFGLQKQQQLFGVSVGLLPHDDQHQPVSNLQHRRPQLSGLHPDLPAFQRHLPIGLSQLLAIVLRQR